MSIINIRESKSKSKATSASWGHTNHPELLLYLQVVQVYHVQHEEEEMLLVHALAGLVLVHPMETVEKSALKGQFQGYQFWLLSQAYNQK